MLSPGKGSLQITWQKEGWPCQKRNLKDKWLQPMSCKLNSSATSTRSKSKASQNSTLDWNYWILLLVCKDLTTVLVCKTTQNESKFDVAVVIWLPRLPRPQRIPWACWRLGSCQWKKYKTANERNIISRLMIFNHWSDDIQWFFGGFPYKNIKNHWWHWHPAVRLSDS